MSTVEDILMVRGPDVIVASSDTTAREATRLMSQANVGSVIIQDNDEVKGIFTERDLLQRVVSADKDPAATPLSEVMSSPVRSCQLADDVDEVAKLLTGEHIRHLAILEQGALIGLVGLRDILAAELRDKDQEITRLRERIGDSE